MKFRKLDKEVLQRFSTLRSELVAIHEFELKDIAYETARELGMPDFKASDFWIHVFKKRNNIVSRKITVIRQKNDILHADEIQTQIAEFRQRIVPY